MSSIFIIEYENSQNGTSNSNKMTSKAEKEIVTEYKLFNNYPNPFNPTTIIAFELPEQTIVTLKVYDILGREVAVLVNEKLESGKHEVEFRADNLASGLYIYNLTAGNYSQSHKMLLLK